MSVRLLAPAKINLTLEVLAKRDDGFHEVRMLMAGVDLYDEMSFTESATLSLTCDRADLSVGEDNLVLRAARALQAASGCRLGAKIHLKKHIPVGGGLAGGSTDAAATLKGLDRLWETALGAKRLAEIAASLGSDIPFCLKSGWALASGRGEKLKALTLGRSLHLVLANPGFEVSTQWVYKNLGKIQARAIDHSAEAFKAIASRNLKALKIAVVNDLELVTASKYEQISAMKEQFMACGAQIVQMSGSGPTVWALFGDERAAKKAQKIMKVAFTHAYYVKTITKIPIP